MVSTHRDPDRGIANISIKTCTLSVLQNLPASGSPSSFEPVLSVRAMHLFAERQSLRQWNRVGASTTRDRCLRRISSSSTVGRQGHTPPCCYCFLELVLAMARGVLLDAIVAGCALRPRDIGLR